MGCVGGGRELVSGRLCVQLSVTSSVMIEIKAEGGQQEAGEVYLAAIE